MQYHSCVCVCVCEFLGMQSPRIGLILVLEGIVFHYMWLKCLLGTVTIYSDILFEHCVKMQNLKKKKKSQTIFSDILEWSEKGKQTSFFLGPTFGYSRRQIQKLSSHQGLR